MARLVDRLDWAAMAGAGAPPAGRLLFVNISPDALGHPGLLQIADTLQGGTGGDNLFGNGGPDQHLGGPGPGVVVRRHAHPVRAGGHYGEEIAFARREQPSACDEIPGFTHRPDDVVGAGNEKRRFEITAVIGRELLRHASADIDDPDARAGNDPASE